MFTSISDDNLRFDLSRMDSSAIDEATTNVVFLSQKALSCDDFSLPQLEPLTPYDDSFSVSSVSTVGSTSATTSTGNGIICTGSGKSTTSTTDRPPRRSLFRKYWKTTGEEPLLSLLRRSQKVPPLASSQSPPSLTEILVPAELLAPTELVPTELAPTAGGDESLSSPIPQRRSIFGRPQAQRCYSAPSLSAISTTPYHRPITRKSASSGELKASSTSCLREARFSGDEQRRANNDNNNSCAASSTVRVRFDMESVDVLLFEKPLESYAADGWSENFVD